jgi:ribosomal protein S27AE
MRAAEPALRDVQERVLIATLQRMRVRRLVKGCPCGECDGSWSITLAGSAELERMDELASGASSKKRRRSGADRGEVYREHFASDDRKTCSRCNQRLPLSRFTRDWFWRDGLSNDCSDCRAVSTEGKKQAMRRYNHLNPHKQRARKAVKRAVDSGRLVRPSACPRCGDTESAIHAHHPDYSKPLDVEWLCGACHGRLHGKDRWAQRTQ